MSMIDEKTVCRKFKTNISMMSFEQAKKLQDSGKYDLCAPMGQLFYEFIDFMTIFKVDQICFDLR
jgi:hypothetical protein